MCCGAALRKKSPLRVTSSRFRAENVDFERELLEILHSFDFKQRIMILSKTNLRNDTFFTPFLVLFLCKILTSEEFQVVVKLFGLFNNFLSFQLIGETSLNKR